MQPTEDSYAIFEANQVLTSDHLNDDFNYLDEQERLTRANLVGIGIVCGLEVTTGGDAGHQTVAISKGCGVTSAGYLIVLEDGGFTADRCREYTAPDDLAYPLFINKTGQAKGKQYALYELLDKDRDEYANGIPISQGLIVNPVVLLFLELEKGNLKNCSPVSCDDKGLRVNVTVRKLLIAADDLKKMNSEIADQLQKDGLSGDFFPDLEGRLDLPDLQLPRLDVPNSKMQTAQNIFMAYKRLLTPALFKNLEAAMSKTWKVFQPALQESAPADPFAGLVTTIGEKYLKLTTNRQVIFSQYYYDFVDDLIQGYEELRWKGMELMSLCCPPSGLHPRHLMLGEVNPAADVVKSSFRHYFRPSPAVTNQARLRQEVLQLFNRLVLMVRTFDETTAPSGKLTVADNVRITPSRIGTQPLSRRAIPYYYDTSKGSPLLYERWDYMKTSVGRSRQNLGYNSPLYAKDDFVLNPLNYDLQAYNFFRIEGHIGLSWRSVLDDLLKKVDKYRLPFDVVVLNAANATVRSNPWLNRCISNDLQVIYDSWIKEAECTYRSKMKYFTGLKISSAFTTAGVRSAVLSTTAAAAVGAVSAQTARVSAAAMASRISVVDAVVNETGTLGNMFLNVLGQSNVKTGQDIKNNVSRDLKGIAEVNNLSGKDYDLVFGSRLDLVAAVYDYTTALPDDAATMDVTTIDSKFAVLSDAVKRYRDLVSAFVPPAQNPAITQADKDEILKQLNSLLDNCLQERLKLLQAEIISRRQQMEEMIYFSRYVQNHPDLQHKAGVTVGGTFVLVFQETPNTVAPPAPPPAVGAAPSVSLTDSGPQFAFSSNQQILADAFTRMGTTLTADVLKRLSSVIPGVSAAQPPFPVPDGVVIADFYIPYMCCSDCPPVQFVLPAPPLGVSIETACTNPETRKAEATITVTGGEAPYVYQLDGGPFIPVDGNPLLVTAGSHTVIVRDSVGTQSTPSSLPIPEPLTIGEATFADLPEQGTYTVAFSISGGVAPYKDSLSSGVITNNIYTSAPVGSGKPLNVEITDSKGCKASTSFTHTVCDLPCGGKAIRGGYVFWVPEPTEQRKIERYAAAITSFRFISPDEKEIDLANLLKVDSTADALNADFTGVVKRWIKEINAAIANHESVKRDDWFKLDFRKDASNGFAALMVEHFACHPFVIQIKEEHSFRELLERRTIEYTEKGTQISVEQFPSVQIPVFGSEETNKCLPSQEWNPLCSGADFKLEMRPPEIDPNNGVTLAAEFSGPEKPVQFLWQVQDAVPAVLIGENVKTFLARLDRPTTMVRLTAFSKTGCVVSIERTVDPKFW